MDNCSVSSIAVYRENTMENVQVTLALNGKVALVTGGASGIGLAIARRLGEAGARVAAADLVPSPAEGNVFGIRIDVTEEADWASAVAQVEAQAGKLDILVNNAGIGAPSPLVELPLSDWRKVITVNLDGAFLGIKHTVPALRRNGGGSIVNVASMLASVAVPGAAAYCASKGGLVALTRAAAVELAADSIRVNAVQPGWIETPLLRSRLAAQPERAAAMLETTPAGRLGRPEDVAGAVLYLVSDDATFITGTTLTMDGGYTAR
jgi:NAD(P)-dependent dehydrogenase (short-subunit alcohol dehydrogenase family)